MKRLFTIAAVIVSTAVSQAGETQRVKYETRTRQVCENGVCRVVTETVAVVVSDAKEVLATPTATSCPCVAVSGSCPCAGSSATGTVQSSGIGSRLANWRANRVRLFGGCQ